MDRDVIGWSLTVGLTFFFWYKIYGMVKYHCDKYHIISAFQCSFLPKPLIDALNAGLDDYVENQSVGKSLDTIRSELAKVSEQQKSDAQKDSSKTG